jgi:outer membrane immunogenic protein
MKKILTSIVLVISAGTASAADMPQAAPYQKAAYVSPAYNWTGFYIGAMGGYGWSDQVRATVGGLTVSASSNDLKGGFGGGTLGYNWQTGQFVFGIETDDACRQNSIFWKRNGPVRLCRKRGTVLCQGRLRLGG